MGWPIDWTVAVDWSGDGTFAGTGEDLTALGRVKGTTELTMSYGRDQARRLAPTAPGEASFELNNQSRDYSPDNASSPLYGNVRPGRPVRIQVAAMTLAADTFSRTVASGWGTADTGGAWATAGGSASDYAVSGGTGRHAHTSVNVERRTTLTSSSVTDFDLTVASISGPAGPTGGNVSLGVRARYVDGTNFVETRVFFVVGGTVTVNLRCLTGGVETTTGFVTASGVGAAGPVSLRFTGAGSTLRARLWATGGTEPDDWQVELDAPHVAAGQVVLRSLLNTGNTNTLPYTVQFDGLSVVFNAVNLFRGNLDDFTLQPGMDQKSVQVTCLDALAQLRGVNVSTGLFNGLRTGECIALVLDAAGWPADARDLDVGASVVPWFWAASTDAYDLLQQLVDSEGPGALLTSDGEGRVVFRGRHHRILSTASTTVQATLSGLAEPAYSQMSYGHGWKEIINQVEFSVPLRQLSGQLTAVWSSQGSTTLSDGETVLFRADAGTPFAGAIVPEQDVDYQLVTGVVEVTLSRTHGQLVVIAVKAVGGAAVITDLQLRAFSLQTVSTVQVSAVDSTSVQRYGPRSLPDQREPVWASLQDQYAIADLILAQRAERLATVMITLWGGSAVRLAQQLSRNLSDRVRIKATNAALDDDFFIERIEHRWTGAQLQTTFGCEMARGQVDNVFMFDTAGRGFDQGNFGVAGQDNASTLFMFDVAGQGFDQGLLGT